MDGMASAVRADFTGSGLVVFLTSEEATSGLRTIADSTVDAAAALGSQAWHSRTEGGISRPHSGQIQWNMNQMYTVMLCKPFRDKPYRTHLGTLG